MADEFKTIAGVLEDFGIDSVAALQSNLDGSDTNVTFNLRQSITFEVKFFATNLRFRLSLADYYRQVDEGRGPTTAGGSGQVKNEIEKWINNRGIVPKPSTLTGITPTRKQLAFLISRKIHREGFKGNQFYSKVINQNTLDELSTKVAEAFGKDVQIFLEDL